MRVKLAECGEVQEGDIGCITEVFYLHHIKIDWSDIFYKFA